LELEQDSGRIGKGEWKMEDGKWKKRRMKNEGGAGEREVAGDGGVKT
jgi:hypothetical protein